MRPDEQPACRAISRDIDAGLPGGARRHGAACAKKERSRSLRCFRAEPRLELRGAGEGGFLSGASGFFFRALGLLGGEPEARGFLVFCDAEAVAFCAAAVLRALGGWGYRPRGAARAARERERDVDAEPIARAGDSDEGPSFWRRALGWAAVPSRLADTDELLQERVALYLKAMFGIMATFMGGMSIAAVTSVGHLELPPGAPAGVGVTFAVGALWLYARGGPRTAPTLRWLEAGGTVLIGAAEVAIVAALPTVTSPELVGSLALTSMLGLRAALVPSPAGRTCLVSALAFLPMIAFAANRYPEMPRMEVAAWQKLLFIRTPMFALSAVAMTTITSYVIYGLHASVAKARQLGQYTLGEKLGEGGMGMVFRATHVMLRRPTAIKLLPPDRSSEESIKRFEREVIETSRLMHPNTVAIFDFGRTDDNVFYYAMEHLDGFSLEQLLRLDGPQPAGRVIHLLKQACASLAEAHDAGLVHRDVKPANMMVTQRAGISDFVKVLDFGLVKQVEGDGGAPDLTHENTITGTPHYMAPEAVTAPQTLDARADIYALGAVAYALLTGTTVFTGASLVDVLGKHVHEAPTRPADRLGEPVPRDLEDVVLSCLRKSPSDRPASAAELARALDACADASAWTQDDARTWWRERAASLREGTKREQKKPGTAGASREQTLESTVAVAFERR